jgi:hypothetical protein
MSRRLEVIPTGFVDYGKVAQSFMGGVQQGMNLVAQEEERQRRLKEVENQRFSVANQLYRQNQADLERFGTDLTTAEKLKFTGQFDGIMKMNRDLQDWIFKGGKVGSPEYNALQDNIEKSKKSLQMNIGNLKEVKSAISEANALQKNKFLVDPEQISQLSSAYNQILEGKYVPSIDLPSKQTIVGSSYISPNAIYESVIPKIQYTEKNKVFKEGKVVKTYKQKTPNYFELETAALDLVNRSPVESAGIIKDFQRFKEASKSDLGDFKNRYDLYSIYMKEEGKTPKSAEEFTPSDFSMMELVSRSYKPSADEFQRYSAPKTGGGGGGKKTQAEKDADKMNMLVDDIFSGDPSKSNDAISKLSGGLKVKGFTIKKVGDNLSVVKSKDEFTDALNITIPLTKSSESVASLQSVINSYFSAIGAGRKL